MSWTQTASLSTLLHQARSQFALLLQAKEQEYNFDFLAGVPTQGKFKWEEEFQCPLSAAIDVMTYEYTREAETRLGTISADLGEEVSEYALTELGDFS
jgi:hypothetical protein